MSKEIIVEIKHMTKSFGSTIALNDVNITVRNGEILGLIGENGSGKSTVTSILSGMQSADHGEMFFKNKVWKPTSMLDALNNGIGMIVQETGTIPGITVAENIFLGESENFVWGNKKFKHGLISKKEMNLAAKKALEFVGADNINPDVLTNELDLQERKLIEIARIINKNPDVLIVDETTTALSQTGRNSIYKLMDKMRKDNKAVIFISHDLDEIMNICDTLTVLRDGKIIITFEQQEFDEELIKTSMIGRELQGDYYRSDYNASIHEEVVLCANNISYGKTIKNVSFELHKGEILGIGGLSHCGMHELGKILFANAKPTTGAITIKGKKPKNENQSMNLKVGYVAKDRDTDSLSLNASIKDNISIAGFSQFSILKFLILNFREKQYVKGQIETLKIKCRSMNQYASTLSGGNKQKVVFGKWIGRGSEILILDCPTRGVDIGVKQSMYQLMYKMKQEGKSIVIISEELSELIGMTDRLMIMKDGIVSNVFERSPELSESDVIHYMI